MKKLKKRKIIIISTAVLLFLSWIVFINTSYYKLKNLYKNPIEINKIYKDYIYDEYSNYVVIRTYNGQDSKVNIPIYINDKPVLAIEDSAFYANTKLESVKVPKYVIRIGHQAFIGCPKLKKVSLPNNVLDIGKWSFKGCPNLEKIYVKRNSRTDKNLKKSSFKKYIVYY